jgi:hypothetical protein
MRIGVKNGDRHFQIGNASDGSKAQLTPRGDLLIDGKAVPVTPQQRAMLLDYRRQIVAVAETGMAIGVKGADLGGKAVLETFSGLMHGNADEAGKRIEPKPSASRPRLTRSARNCRRCWVRSNAWRRIPPFVSASGSSSLRSFASGSRSFPARHPAPAALFLVRALGDRRRRVRSR